MIGLSFLLKKKNFVLLIHMNNTDYENEYSFCTPISESALCNFYSHVKVFSSILPY